MQNPSRWLQGLGCIFFFFCPSFFFFPPSLFMLLPFLGFYRSNLQCCIPTPRTAPFPAFLWVTEECFHSDGLLWEAWRAYAPDGGQVRVAAAEWRIWSSCPPCRLPRATRNGLLEALHWRCELFVLFLAFSVVCLLCVVKVPGLMLYGER